MDHKFKHTVLSNRKIITEMWLEDIDSFNNLQKHKTISDDLFESINKEFINIIFIRIEEGGSVNDFEDFTEKLINLGWPLSYVTNGLQSFRRVAIDFILNQTEKVESEHLSALLKSADKWVEPIIQQLVNEYSGSWEQIVSLQRVALQELSAPLIPVLDNITIMPLVGTIDTERAKLIMENLLEGVIKHHSDVVLIDITGVPIVDTMVAHHIIQAAEAVRLVGSTCILVGIRPEIAQTIVSLGIDLSDFPTRNSLQKGFEEALKITDRNITDQRAADEDIDKMIDSLDGA